MIYSTRSLTLTLEALPKHDLFRHVTRVETDKKPMPLDSNVPEWKPCVCVCVWHCYQSCRGVDFDIHGRFRTLGFTKDCLYQLCQRTTRHDTMPLDGRQKPPSPPPLTTASCRRLRPHRYNKQEAAAALTRFHEQAPGADDAPEEDRQLRQPISASEVDEASNMIFQRTSTPSGTLT